MKAFRLAVLQLKCPTCHRGPTHWCRDDHGHVLPLAHVERTRAALGLLMAPLAPDKAGAR